jgi:hypothetical protein
MNTLQQKRVKQGITEEFFEAVFPMWSVPRLYRQDASRVDGVNMSEVEVGLRGPRAAREQQMGMSPTGKRIKNRCTGEGQQRFSIQ